MKKIIILFAILFLSFSCAVKKYIEVPVETIKTEYVNKYLHDSIFVKDSVDRYKTNDTIYITNYRTERVYQFKTDTVLKTDSIPYTIEVPVVQEVNKLKWYQEALMWIGVVLLIVLIIFICIKVIKLIIKIYVK